MEKASKADFKEAMRRAKIKEEVEQEMNESIIGDSAAAYFATDSQVDTDEPRKPSRPKKTKVKPVAPKKRGRKPKTQSAPKEPVAAGQEEVTMVEALKGLVEIADRWINGRKVDADRYKKISEDINAQVTQYQVYIDRVKEMIQ